MLYSSNNSYHIISPSLISFAFVFSLCLFWQFAQRQHSVHFKPAFRQEQRCVPQPVLHLQSTYSRSESGAEGRVIQTISSWPSDNLQPLPTGGKSCDWGWPTSFLNGMFWNWTRLRSLCPSLSSQIHFWALSCNIYSRFQSICAGRKRKTTCDICSCLFRACFPRPEDWRALKMTCNARSSVCDS